MAALTSFLREFLEIFLNSSPVRRRQPGRINMSHLGFVLLRSQLVGGFQGEMLQFIHQLPENPGIELALCLELLFELAQELPGALAVAMLGLQAALEIK